MKLVHLVLALVVTFTAAGTVKADVKPGDISGDWTGALTVPNGQIPLVFHLSTAGGALVATLDSPMQNSYGMKADTATISGDTVTVIYPTLKGTMEGTVSPDDRTITGTWSQGTPMPLIITRIMPVKLPVTFNGTWAGILATPRGALHVKLIFGRTPTGMSIVDLQSPDQGPATYPASSITLTGRSINISFTALGAAFVGTVDSSGRSLSGNWNQGGVGLPLTLKSTG